MESTRSMWADSEVDPRELWDAVDAYLVRYGGDFVPELVSSASGSRLYTVDGRSILDFTSGQMCATLGHNHPAVVAAIKKACREVIHLFSGMLAPPVVLLARELAGLLPPALDKVLFLSTGGESNEAALRLAKL
jgi:2,2-dialkylglycine decarboxylase (pyruvate)